MGPDRGGLEVRRTGPIRPAPSGIIADGTADADIPNLAVVPQGSYTITLDSTDIEALTPNTSGLYFYEGLASAGGSLLNVREKLNLIAAQFTTKAAAQTFPWRCEVQGLRLIFRPTTGDANTGYNVDITSTASDLIAAFAVTKTSTRALIVGTLNLSLFQTDGATGSNGAAPTINEYAEAYEVIRREVDLFNLLILPRDVDIDDPTRVTLWGPASTFCQQRRAFLLVDPPLSWTSVDQITSATPRSTGHG